MFHALLAAAVLAAPAAKAPAPKAAPAPAGAPVKDFANAPSILHITSEKWMTMVLVDGTPLMEGDCTSPKACDVVDVAPGPHELDIRSGAFGGKTIFKGLVHVTGGAEIWGKAHDNQFTIYNTQARALPQGSAVVIAAAPAAGGTTTTTQTTTTTIGGAPGNAGGVSIGMNFVDPDTGETVNMGVSAGAFGGTATVTEQTTVTTTTVNGCVATAPASVAGAPGVLELTSQDGESFTVFLDGRKVATFNGLSGQTIKVKNVAPGEHKLVIKDFMEDETWTAGRLFMDAGFTLKLGVEDGRLEAYNRRAAWRPGAR